MKNSSDSRAKWYQLSQKMGCHSLVEQLARTETRQEMKNAGLRQAVSAKRLDLVQLLVEHGAEIASIDFADVLLELDPTMIRYFLDIGADVVTRSPFAIAFREKVRIALRPLVAYKKAHPEVEAELQPHADRALRISPRNAI